MNKQLFEKLKASAGMYIPLYPDAGGQQNLRYEHGSPAADFPSHMKREGTVQPKVDKKRSLTTEKNQ